MCSLSNIYVGKSIFIALTLLPNGQLLYRSVQQVPPKYTGRASLVVGLRIVLLSCLEVNILVFIECHGISRMEERYMQPYFMAIQNVHDVARRGLVQTIVYRRRTVGSEMP